MSCKISKNRFGKIVAVNNQQGEKSTLFQQILNVPSIALNDAIEMYKGIYSDKLKGKVQFQQIFPPQKSSEKGQITQEIIDKLKQNGLSEDVFLLSTEEIRVKLKQLKKEGLTDSMMEQVIAWHGSPHFFNKFTTDKMGTGEGAQAFGWGLYFTDLESIARNYASTLANLEILGAPQRVNDALNYVFTVVNNPFKGKSDYTTKEELESFLSKASKYAEGEQYGRGEDKELFQIVDIVWEYVQDNYDTIEIKANRNLYKVSLHKGKTPDQYTWLEWDKPVPQKIMNEVGEKLISNGKKLKDLFDNSREYEKTDGTKVKGLYPDGLMFYKRISQILGGDKEASLFLLENGIDGIKYPAESISRGATSDTARGFNYVVFDENAITIEEQIQFSKSLNNVGINLITNGFTVKEYPTNSKILDILIAKNVIEKVC